MAVGEALAAHGSPVSSPVLLQGKSYVQHLKGRLVFLAFLLSNSPLELSQEQVLFVVC